MDKIQAKKLYKPLFYLPLQAFENMNKKLLLSGKNQKDIKSAAQALKIQG